MKPALTLGLFFALCLWSAPLGAQCDFAPPSTVTCEAHDTDVSLAWINGDTYDGIRIERDGNTLVELAGTATAYINEDVASGFYDYVVLGLRTAEDCGSGSEPCSVIKGITFVCNEEDTVVDVFATVTSTIAIEDDVVVDEVGVRFEMDTTWVPEYDLFLTNPDGDEVQLFNNATPTLGVYDDFDVRFITWGDPQPLPTYDCDGCPAAPSGPGVLADLGSGPSVGSWDLRIVSGTYGTSSTLTHWCLELFIGCDIPRPVITSCEATNSWPPVNLTWEGTAGADFITIIRDGITIDDSLPGTATSYTDSGITHSGRLLYQVGYGSNELDCVRASVPCETDPVGRYSDCSTESASVPADTIVLAILDWSNDTLAQEAKDPGFDGTITDVEADIDLTTATLGDWDITLSSPDGTSVQLHDDGAGAAADLRVTYSDDGASTVTHDNNTCECLVRPSGPGTMSDFVSEEPFGEWTLALHSLTEGTLTHWCVGLYVYFHDEPPPPPPPEILFKRGDANNNGVVDPLSDALRLLQWGFAGGLAPPCRCAADADGNHAVSPLNDAIRLLSWGFSGGTAPPAPGPTTCGTDPQDPEGCDLTGLDTPEEACGTTTGHGRLCEP